jgi:hypothetical protein
VDVDEGLVFLGRGEVLGDLDRDGRILFDQNAAPVTLDLDRQRMRRDIEQDDLFESPGQHSALHGGADGHDLIGVDAPEGDRPKKSSTRSWTSGVRVVPPTRMTLLICFLRIPASLSALRQQVMDSSMNGSMICSSVSRVSDSSR